MSTRSVPIRYHTVAGKGKLADPVSAQDLKDALAEWQKTDPPDFAAAAISRLFLALKHITDYELSFPVVKNVWRLFICELVRVLAALTALARLVN